ncbi:MAG: 2-amino-4-hydroxy-6-hydroxymethyldihydropteridine diphosphokinase [Gammaproteobacteria bacterium]|nr:2-amino-4-hydroxy-6-hydroxymethyldihydropteridine diphosphokinase [Gammaproteobacteria bacterium]
MNTVFLGLGSNIDAEENLRLGVRELSNRYGELTLSPVYRSAPLGFEGEDFLNMVVAMQTDRAAAAINDDIDEIHGLAGRERSSDRFVSRPLDIDLLLYGDAEINEGKVRVPRSDILEYSFVLAPLADLAPELKHPQTGKTMLEHWESFDPASHPIELVDVIL